jgi:predicted phage baseplate assembly protein
MRWPQNRPLPAISLDETDERGHLIDRWQPLDDLLASGPESKAFVVEVENDGTACLRFGDDQFGARPKSINQLSATYRIGNGAAGNVGRETIAHLVTAETALLSDVITRVWNPLPAQGGVEPESIESVRQRAPSAFLVQDRAVSPRDYQDVVKRCNLGVQRAAATFRWTGSWRTVFITADRSGGAPVDARFAGDLQACVEPFRMAGLDLHADEPIFVPLEIAMAVCVDRAYFASHVRQALLAIFTNGLTPTGKRGLFHPDNFTFGQTVYLSPLFAAAQGVAGVASVRVTTFQRRGRPETQGIDTGKLTFEALEIPRLDNDRNFPDRGTFSLTVEGGR